MPTPHTRESKFAWSVAFQTLCHIKAVAQGSLAFTAEGADLTFTGTPASTNVRN